MFFKTPTGKMISVSLARIEGFGVSEMHGVKGFYLTLGNPLTNKSITVFLDPHEVLQIRDGISDCVAKFPELLEKS